MQAVQIDNSKTPCKGNSINNQCFFPLQGVLFLTYITSYTFFNIKGLIFITKTTKNEKESF